MRQSLRQFGLERSDELATGGGECAGGPLAADEDDAGGEGVGAGADVPRSQFVRIGQVPLMAKPASITAARKVSQPVLVVPSSPSLSSLFEGIVDGDRKGRMRLLGEAVHRLRHSVEKEGLCLLPCCRGDMGARPTPQPLARQAWRRDWENWLQRTAQPNVEEIRQVRVADVVVVRWVCRNNLSGQQRLLRLSLNCISLP